MTWPTVLRFPRVDGFRVAVNITDCPAFVDTGFALKARVVACGDPVSEVVFEILPLKLSSPG